MSEGTSKVQERIAKADAAIKKDLASKNPRGSHEDKDLKTVYGVLNPKAAERITKEKSQKERAAKQKPGQTPATRRRRRRARRRRLPPAIKKKPHYPLVHESISEKRAKLAAAAPEDMADFLFAYDWQPGEFVHPEVCYSENFSVFTHFLSMHPEGYVCAITALSHAFPPCSIPRAMCAQSRISSLHPEGCVCNHGMPSTDKMKCKGQELCVTCYAG